MIRIDEYVQSQDSLCGVDADDVDLVKELSTINRLRFDPSEDGGFRDEISVKYRPDEIVSVIAGDEWKDYHETPVETTVMTVDEDEILDHETVANRERV